MINHPYNTPDGGMEPSYGGQNGRTGSQTGMLLWLNTTPMRADTPNATHSFRSRFDEEFDFVCKSWKFPDPLLVRIGTTFAWWA